METLHEKWDEILKHFKDFFEITDAAFNTFIKPLEIYSVDGTDLFIVTSAENNEFGIGFIERKYGNFLRVAIADITGIEYTLHFRLSKELEMNTTTSFSDSILTQNDNYQDSNLVSKYTFDNFVVGKDNNFAYTAALAVSESPGEQYNPLYIYGGPGLGKTHLLHSIGNYILSQNPEKKVLYVTSEDFTNDVIDSIRRSNNKYNDKYSGEHSHEVMQSVSNSDVSAIKLREKYRNVDVLLIDDIQFIIGKNATQEEFFHTFNHLHNNGKHVVLTSDKLPREMEALDSRYKSRFEWGLMADIGCPDYETRMAILLKKMENTQVHISDDILAYIADNIKSNVREIEGALNKLIAYHNLGNQEITMEIAVSELSNIISPEKTKEITPQYIIEIVAEHYNISIEEMCSKKRTSNIAKPRQVAMYLCKEMTEYPFQSIGELLGGKDHTTIMYGYKKISDEYKDDEFFKQEVDIIKKKINPTL